MRVLGVDPGLNVTGYALVEASECWEPGGESPRLVEAGVIRLRRSRTIAQRVLELDHDLGEIVERLRPEAAGIEGLFAHYRHPATAIAMAHARGVVLLRLQSAGATLMELKPGVVKKALTGNGMASKPQVQRAIADLFRLGAPPEPPDVADAMAIAWCAARRLFGGNDSTRRR